MIAQKGYFQGFNLDTEDAYGTHKSYLAGFNRFNGEIIGWGYDNSKSTYQVKGTDEDWPAGEDPGEDPTTTK